MHSLHIVQFCLPKARCTKLCSYTSEVPFHNHRKTCKVLDQNYHHIKMGLMHLKLTGYHLVTYFIQYEN